MATGKTVIICQSHPLNGASRKDEFPKNIGKRYAAPLRIHVDDQSADPSGVPAPRDGVGSTMTQESLVGRSLVLHIGLTKTGSTFLQEEIFSKHPDILFLGKRAMRFARPGTPPTPDRYWFKPLQKALRVKRGPRRYATLMRNLAARTRDDEKVLVASSEDFLPQRRHKYAKWGALDYRIFLRNLGKFAEIWEQSGGRRLRVIVVIRRQDTWLASHYLQAVPKLRSLAKVSPSQRHFGKCVRRLIETEFRAAPFLFFDRLFEDLSDTVGSENLHVAVYENLRANPDQFCNSLLGFCGVGPFDFERRDVRPSRTECERTWTNEFLSIELTEQQSRRILRVFQRPNRRASRMIGTDLEEHGYFKRIRKAARHHAEET